MSSMLLTLAALASVGSAPVAALRVDAGEATFQVTVQEDISVGYRLRMRCTERCVNPLTYEEVVGDRPMGLFANEGGFVFSTWSAGSAYRVRVWKVGDSEIRKVGEFSSWHRQPDFMTDNAGRSIVRTYEGGFDSGLSLRPVLWAYSHGRFRRQVHKRR